MDDDFAAEIQSIEREISRGKIDTNNIQNGASGNSRQLQTGAFNGLPPEGDSHSHAIASSHPFQQQQQPPQVSSGGVGAGPTASSMMTMMMGSTNNASHPVNSSSVFPNSFGGLNVQSGGGHHLAPSSLQSLAQPPSIASTFGTFGANPHSSSMTSSMSNPSSTPFFSSSPASGTSVSTPRMSSQISSSPSPHSTHTFSKDTDERSVFVGNLPKQYPITKEELMHLFSECGPILNCTLLRDRVTQELKGTAYIEFSSYSAMGKAIDTMNNATFKGNSLVVTKKRSGFRSDRGRGGRGGRGGAAGGLPGAADPYQAIAAIMGLMSAGAVAGTGRGGYRGRGGGRSRGGASGSPDGSSSHLPFP